MLTKTTNEFNNNSYKQIKVYSDKPFPNGNFGMSIYFTPNGNSNQTFYKDLQKNADGQFEYNGLIEFGAIDFCKIKIAYYNKDRNYSICNNNIRLELIKV